MVFVKAVPSASERLEAITYKTKMADYLQGKQEEERF
jgi:hypothetical protein